MTNSPTSATTDEFSHKAIEAAIRIGFVTLLLVWCFHIAGPFINPLVWGIIIAVAIYPLHRNLSNALGSREKLSAILITAILIFIILGPCVFFAEMISENTKNLSSKLHNQTFVIPTPNEKVADWPLIGEPIYSFWQKASVNISDAAKQLAPELKPIGAWLISSSVSVMGTIFQFLVSVIICGILLLNGTSGHELAVSFGKRVAGKQGGELTELSIATIRGVARGVLGVAFIQALLAGAGFFVAEVPGAGILTLACLLIAIVQLPTLLLFLPTIIYVFSEQEAFSATVFMVWMLMVGSLDNFLKPILMGRGIDLPIAVIFIGAIGGMMYSGIIGLFVGAVVLALGYKLFLSWLKAEENPI
ncbi:AI-2E family transporter [Methylomonas sp. MgM2]